MKHNAVILKSCFAAGVATLATVAMSGCSAGSFLGYDLFTVEPEESVKPHPPAKDQLARARFFMPIEPQKRLPAPKLLITPEVQREINYFLRRDARFISAGLERRMKYLPMIRQIFLDEGLPDELLNVGLIESGFKVDAKSYAGAVGMWQFMKSTARLYGLKVGLFEDQRKDPILSTIAAARHLRDLYFAYDDWLLALAAYNAGSGFIDRTLIRTGAKEFWLLARSGRLRKQTVQYVARFVAVTAIMKEPERFGLAKDAFAPYLEPYQDTSRNTPGSGYVQR